jgi:hypothetical protein
MALLIGVTAAVWALALVTGLRAVRARGVVATLRGLLLAAIFGSAGTVLAALLLVLQAFQAFSGETLVAQVTTRRLGAEAFELTYAPLPAAARWQAGAGGTAGAGTTVRLAGDQWSISGGIVKWHPWFTALGLRSYHRPTRIAGQFSDLARQRRDPPTVYPLAGSPDRLWEALYWVDPYLPFVEAVYGSSAYVYVEPGRVHEVYVTPSGYLIKRK